VFSTFVVVTGAPYSVLERLVEAPGHQPLLFPNSELFAALERHISDDAKAVYTALADARAVYAAALDRGETVDEAENSASRALEDQLDIHVVILSPMMTELSTSLIMYTSTLL